MNCFNRSMERRISQEANRSGWRLSRARLLAGDTALLILKASLCFCDERWVKSPPLTVTRLGREGSDWSANARSHQKHISERIICQASHISHALLTTTIRWPGGRDGTGSHPAWFAAPRAIREQVWVDGHRSTHLPQTYALPRHALTWKVGPILRKEVTAQTKSGTY